jgi:acyl-CoA reductase-like NAD-dependent aldehyde dehydrogenase
VGPETIQKFAGRNGQLLYEFANGDGSEVAAAVANARQAFDDGRWRNLSSGERGDGV